MAATTPNLLAHVVPAVNLRQFVFTVPRTGSAASTASADWAVTGGGVAATTAANAAVAFTLTGSDADNDALTFSLVSGPTNGTLNLNTNDSFSYTPATNFTGTDLFTYQASDGAAAIIDCTRAAAAPGSSETARSLICCHFSRRGCISTGSTTSRMSFLLV